MEIQMDAYNKVHPELPLKHCKSDLSQVLEVTKADTRKEFKRLQRC